MSIRKLLPLVAFAAVLAYATSAQTNAKAISYDDALAFERSLLARDLAAAERPEKRFIQPHNKVEECKLPTTQDQLDRSNFRAYWDGDCKAGFAYGLGRDIAISDTHHIEEITIHDGTGDNWSQPRVLYDYVHKQVGYQMGGSVFPANTSLTETMDDSIKGFNAHQVLSVVDDAGDTFIIQSSAFEPETIYLLIEQHASIGFKFTDLSSEAASEADAMTFSAFAIDPQTGVSGNVGVALYSDGSARHVRVVNGEPELVKLPEAYIDHLLSKYQKILTMTSSANASLQAAQQIEREYLYKACNGKSSVSGLDDDTYTKICTWRDQFKEPYAHASMNYQHKLDSMRQRAATAEQQRQIQQQIALQQQMLQQQQDQQVWNNLAQTTQQLERQTQQRLNGLSRGQGLQVQPIAPPGGNKVVCNTIGSITTCR